MKYATIQLEEYVKQECVWPQEGQHILAQYDDESIIVYQAYRPAIGLFAEKNQYFGGEFGLNRMSWIKPNFLWMMYRSNWARTPGQEVVLAIRLKRNFFDQVVKTAVPSTYDNKLYQTREEWKHAVHKSDVRLQWDPDHDPAGGKCIRRAIQLGLRGKMLEQYSQEAIIEIINVSQFVTEQRKYICHSYENLRIPLETVYPLK